MSEHPGTARRLSQVGRTLVATASIVLALTFAQCRSSEPAIVFLGSAHERFDHNRSVAWHSWAYSHPVAPGETEQRTIRFVNLAAEDAFAPKPRAAIPQSATRGADDLPAASLVPLFPGVALPLDDDVPGGAPDDAWSDRGDLLDFLRSRRAGLAISELPESTLEEIEARFSPILAALADESTLADRASIERWAAEHGVPISFAIVDPRYAAGAFAERIALSVHDFWFVLFRPHDVDRFSRLVVVPTALEGQDFDAKTVPGGAR